MKAYLCAALLSVFVAMATGKLIEEVYGILGNPITLSYSPSENQEIEYCNWTPPGRILNSRAMKVGMLDSINKVQLGDGKCELSINSLETYHFGVWECLVIFMNPTTNDPFVIYYLNVTEGRIPNPPTILNKVKYGSIISGSILNPAQNNDTVDLICCTENGLPPPTLEFLLDNITVAIQNRSGKSNFCIEWIRRFRLNDNGKTVECKLSYIQSKNDDILLRDKFSLNILHSPTFVDESLIDKNIVSKLFSPKDITEFSIKFKSNPSSNISFWILDINGSNVLSEFVGNDNSIASYFLRHFPETQTYEFDFTFRNPDFVNNVKNYRIQLSNQLGSTWLDFSVTQLVYDTGAGATVSHRNVEVVDLFTGDATNVSCCLLRMPVTNNADGIIINLLKGEEIIRAGVLNETRSQFCVKWDNISFSWNDQDRLLSCNSGDSIKEFELTIIGSQTKKTPAAQLNILSGPIILSDGVNSIDNGRIVLNASLNPLHPSLFHIDFVSNPVAFVSRVELLTPWGMDSLKRQKLNLNFAQVFYKAPNGTVTFKPTKNLSEIVGKNINSKLTRNQICIGLENIHGSSDICFYVKVEENPEAITALSTEKSLRESSQQPPTLKYYVNSFSTPTSLILSQDTESPSTKSPTPSDLTKSHNLSSSTWVSTTVTNNIAETRADTTDTVKIELNTTQFEDESDFDLSDGFFTEHQSNDDSWTANTGYTILGVQGSTASQRPMPNGKPEILGSRSIQVIRECDSRETNVTAKILVDQFVTTNVIWKILNENGTYVSLDPEEYLTSQQIIDENLLLTTLTQLDCNSTSSEKFEGRNSYFHLVVENEYGRDELRAVILAEKMSTSPSAINNNIPISKIIIVSTFALCILLLLVFLFATQRNRRCLFGTRRSMQWILDE